MIPKEGPVRTAVGILAIAFSLNPIARAQDRPEILSAYFGDTTLADAVS